MPTIENINGFIWAICESKEESQEFFLLGNEISALCQDNTDYLLTEYSEFKWLNSFGVKMGTKIGAKEELEADYNEAKARNKENRSFEEWCLTKIEM